MLEGIIGVVMIFAIFVIIVIFVIFGFMIIMPAEVEKAYSLSVCNNNIILGLEI